MIRVKQLHIENVGPFTAQDFDFSIEEGHPDIHIFTGINGTGKTTILHAIAAMFDRIEEGGNHKEYLSNQFVKRFRLKSRQMSVTVDSFALARLDSMFYEKSGINLICYPCGTCGNIHRQTATREILDLLVGKEMEVVDPEYPLQEYSDHQRGALAMEVPKRPLSFAAFGYSGYRLISSSLVTIGNEGNFNPLHEALEFVKKGDSNSNITNWIVSRHASAAVADSGGDKNGAKKIRQALDTLIGNIEALTDQYKFSIQTNPWKVSIQYFDQEVEFDVLPDGLRSILSWMGDLLMRLDSIPWVDKSIPVNEQRIILLLDEIEVHLHPKWQYQILPLTQKIFPNAQIFITTHSPFILNSIDNAKIYRLKTERGEAKLDDVVLSNTGDSYSYVYEHILETHNTFGWETMQDLKRFNALDKEIAKQDYTHEAEFIRVTQKLLKEGEEVVDTISSKLMRLKRITGKDYLHGENHEKAAV